VFGDFNQDCVVDHVDAYLFPLVRDADVPCPLPLTNPLYDFDGDCLLGEVEVDEFFERLDQGYQAGAGCVPAEPMLWPGSPLVDGCGHCRLYGDVVPAECDVNTDDIVCALDGFGNLPPCDLIADVWPCPGDEPAHLQCDGSKNCTNHCAGTVRPACWLTDSPRETARRTGIRDRASPAARA
jgi:hypothetical protein